MEIEKLMSNIKLLNASELRIKFLLVIKNVNLLKNLNFYTEKINF